jgi:Ca2+-binding RTX toxin-like protein
VLELNLAKFNAATLTGPEGADSTEAVQLGGAGNDRLAGNSQANWMLGFDGHDWILGFDGDDRLLGFAGKDTLDGGKGRDTLTGGTGNDTYYVDSVDDGIVETSTGGSADRALTTVSHALASYVENLYAEGWGSISLTGNTLKNTIYGNSGANKINGGLGSDILKGGARRDTFIFSTKLSSANVDRLADYSVTNDTIYLENSVFTTLKAGKLASFAFWKGSKAHDRNDRIIYDASKGYLYYDSDGIGSSKQVLVATMIKNLKMTYAEFTII